MIIYQITNIVNQKIYIGKTTKTADERLRKHFYSAKYGSNTYLHRAMRKHGIQAFQICILEECENFDMREEHWIQELKPHYNMTLGGDGGDTSHSPNYISAMKAHHETRSRDSYATRGMLGKQMPEASKKKISQSNKCPVLCEGVVYDSVGSAESAYPGIKLRGRLDNPRYPEFYRLKSKVSRK